MRRDTTRSAEAAATRGTTIVRVALGLLLAASLVASAVGQDSQPRRPRPDRGRPGEPPPFGRHGFELLPPEKAELHRRLMRHVDTLQPPWNAEKREAFDRIAEESLFLMPNDEFRRIAGVPLEDARAALMKFTDRWRERRDDEFLATLPAEDA